jgi:hypothetical protein
MKALVLICAYMIIKSINTEFCIEYENFFTNMLIVVVVFDIVKYAIEFTFKKK